MSDTAKNLYKKVSALKDLKSAIKEVKKTFTASEPVADVNVTKALPANDPAPETANAAQPLKYLGRKKMLGGVLSHLIGSGNDGDNSYQMDVHLEKYNKGMPCVMLSLMSPKGEVLDHSPEHHKDMKDAIKAIVNHRMKKAWK